jgi:hypothetical protein
MGIVHAGGKKQQIGATQIAAQFFDHLTTRVCIILWMIIVYVIAGKPFPA